MRLQNVRGTNVIVGNVLSTDVFYNTMSNANDLWKNMGVLAVEMEAAGLYMNAAKSRKEKHCANADNFRSCVQEKL